MDVCTDLKYALAWLTMPRTPWILPMTATEILAQLKRLGSENYVRIMRNHGVTQPAYGVKIEELKKIQKRVKKDYQLALDLFDTGVYDAMYLAGLIADDAKMSKQDLERWLAKAGGGPLCCYTVSWVAAEGRHGWELALKWIDSAKATDAAAGWATLTSLVSIKPDAELDVAELKKLLQRVQKTIHTQPDGVRYAMNYFVIALGAYVKPLGALALQTAEKIGKVSVDMGDTACKVPFAPDYIRKSVARNPTGKKKTTCKC
jgi:3-methyladenine DNA glycosylase AlkD